MDHGVVVGMRADPKPDQIAIGFDGQRAIAQADTHGPEPSDLLELQRWVLRILLQQRVIFIGKGLHLCGKVRVSLPERAACEVPHSSRARPLWKSSMAWSANWSSLPLSASRSIV